MSGELDVVELIKRVAVLETQMDFTTEANKEQTKLLNELKEQLESMVKLQAAQTAAAEKQKGMIGGVVLTASAIVAGFSFIRDWGGTLKSIFVTIAK